MDANHTKPNDLRMIEWEDTALDEAPADLMAIGDANPGHRDSGRSSRAAELRAIAFDPFAVAPLPDTWESDSELAWLEFDAAQVEMDLTWRSGRTGFDGTATARM